MTDKKTMKACQAPDYGDIDKMLSVNDSVPYPDLADYSKGQRKCLMIIKTHAVALACGDCRVLSGITRELQGPPSFPYIPGGDCCGVVVEIPKANVDCPFQVGDRVAARFVIGPRDALAEYAVVHQDVCDKVPDNVSSEEAAALAGACPATLLAERIQEGDRVLVFGAGGGVGSHACQIMRKQQKASFIAGVSRTPDRLLQAPLSYDRAIDYTKEDPFEIEEFKEKPFDVVVDLAGGAWLPLQKAYEKGQRSVVKPASQGGRFLTIVPDKAIFEARSIAQGMNLFLWVPLWRALRSRAWARSGMPKYTFAMSLDQERSHLTRTFQMASSGTLKAVVDPKGPFPFSTEGVRKAFRLQETRHGHGKVVVQVSKPV